MAAPPPARIGDRLRPRLSLVLPTYEEREALPRVVAALDRVLGDRLPGACEILVVDDGSPDGTGAVAEDLAAVRPHVRVLHRTGASGLATAVVHGWSHATGDVLGVMDADGQHPASPLPALLDAIEAGAELAVASRRAPGGGVRDWGRLRRLSSAVARGVGQRMVPELGAVSDPMSGFFLIRRTVLPDGFRAPEGYKLLVELLVRAEIRRITEVGFVFDGRVHGRSKASLREILAYLRQLDRLRRHRRPLTGGRGPAGSP